MKVLFTDMWAELTEPKGMVRHPGTGNSRKLSLPGPDGAGGGLETAQSCVNSDSSTCRCWNNSDLGIGHVISTAASFSFHSLIFYWRLQQKLNREWRARVMHRPWESPPQELAEDNQHRYIVFSTDSSFKLKVHYRTVCIRELRKIAPYWVSFKEILLLKLPEITSFKSTLCANEAITWFSRGKIVIMLQ